MGFSANPDVYAPCSCGSGKKYKFCCLARDREERRARQSELRPSWEEEPEAPEPILHMDSLQDRLDSCIDLLNTGRAREAIPRLKKIAKAIPFLPHAYNNLALAYFVVGDLDRAIETAERVDRKIDPKNAFALGSLVHYYLLAGKDDEARDALERLCGSVPRDEFGAYKKCEALARLRQHERVLEAAHEVEGSPPDLAFFAGVALANVGREREAQDELERAESGSLHSADARRFLERLRRGEGPGTLEGDWPYLGFRAWISDGLLERLQKSSDPDRCRGLIRGLKAALDEKPDACSTILSLLAEVGSPEAVEVLRKVAFGKFGTWELRNEALHHLRAMGESLDGPAKIWDGNEWVESPMQQVLVTPDAASPAPDHLKGKLVEQIEAHRRKDHAGAERLARELVGEDPEVPVFRQNLGVALAHNGSTAEAEQEFRRAMDLDPSYLFARGSLATLLLEQGKIAEAWEVVSSAEIAPEVHPSALRALLEPQVWAAYATGKFETLRTTVDSLRELDPDSWVLELLDRPEVRGLTDATEIIWNQIQEQKAKLRQRRLPEPPTADGCLDGLSRQELLRIADALALKPPASRSQRKLRAAVAAWVSDPRRIRKAFEGLSEEPRRALRAVLAAGGAVAHSDFVADHEASRPSLVASCGALDALLEAGLLVTGTFREVESVVMPVEVRQALDAMELG